MYILTPFTEVEVVLRKHEELVKFYTFSKWQTRDEYTFGPRLELFFPLSCASLSRQIS